MVARVFATAGSKVYIGPTYSSTVDTVTEFAALSYTIINGVSTIGEFGDTKTVINFDVIDESRVRKTKGTSNGGALSLVMALDDTDTGQTNLKTAFDSPNAYAFKVEFNDKLTTSGTNSLAMFYGKVTSYAYTMGGANDVARRTVNVEVDSAIYRKAAT
jgi:hypothetical protein